MAEQSLPTAQRENEIGLLDLAIMLAKHKWEILGITLLAAAYAISSVIQTPTIYTSSVKILPSLKSQPTATALLAQLGGGGGGFLDFGGNSFIAMLKSDTVANELVHRFQLQMVYGTKRLGDARASLAGRSEIVSGKDGVIKIEVADEDPQRAAAIANAYVDEVRKVMSSFALTEAAQRRTYFEQQLRLEKDKLTDALLALDRTPRTSLGYFEATRNFRFREIIYELMYKQYETARLDESKDAPMVQVLDKAVPPEGATITKRRLVVILSALGGFAVGMLWAFLREALNRARSSPSQAEGLSQLRQAFWGR